jgi:hypothetical protein
MTCRTWSLLIANLLCILFPIGAADLPNMSPESMREQLRAAARDLPPLKTEYYEAAVNGATAINYKQWKTLRGGELILTREERDLASDGKFSVIDFFVYHNGKKIIHSATVQERRIFIFYPDAGAQAMQSDSDGDGRYDKLTIMDNHEKTIETFAIAPDGRLTPNREADIKEMLEMIDRVEKEMKERFK